MVPADDNQVTGDGEAVVEKEDFDESKLDGDEVAAVEAEEVQASTPEHDLERRALEDVEAEAENESGGGVFAEAEAQAEAEALEEYKQAKAAEEAGAGSFEQRVAEGQASVEDEPVKEDEGVDEEGDEVVDEVAEVAGLNPKAASKLYEALGVAFDLAHGRASREEGRKFLEDNYPLFNEAALARVAEQTRK